MKRIILVFILFFILIIHSNSQNVVLKTPAEIALVKAKELLEAKKYEEALKKLEEVLVSEPNNIEANYYMGSVYQAQGQDEMATRYFVKAKEVIAESMKTNIYGTSEILNLHKLRYQQRYATEQPRLLKEPNTMKDPVRLSEPINSPYSDFGPLINPTGARLYFTSRRPDSNQRSILKNKKKGSEESKNKTEIVADSDEDRYYIEKTGDAWGNPIKLPEPLNSDSNEGVDCFTADNQLMLFTACGLSDGVGSCDLYFSSLEGDRWRNPQNLGNVVNSDGWDGQSSISYDGTKIFFSSARSDSYGSTDIYLVEKNLFGDWGPPSNLGGVVNTPFTEYSPFFSQERKTLC